MATYSWRNSVRAGDLITPTMLNEVSTAARDCTNRHCPGHYTSYNGYSSCSYNSVAYASAYKPNSCCFRSNGGAN